MMDLFGFWTRLEVSAGAGMAVSIPNVPLSSMRFFPVKDSVAVAVKINKQIRRRRRGRKLAQAGLKGSK